MKSGIRVLNQDGVLLVSSRVVAEDFGKQHKHVLNSIENLVAENSAAKFFIESEWESRGKMYPEYLLTRDGFSLLVMGFTGKEALQWKLKYIEAFNQMEQKLKEQSQLPYDPVSILRLAVASLEKQNAEVKQIKEEVIALKENLSELKMAQPSLVATVPIQEEAYYSSSDIADELNISSGKMLNILLNEYGVHYSRGGKWKLYKKYSNRGLTIRKSGHTYWTLKGKEVIRELLKS